MDVSKFSNSVNTSSMYRCTIPEPPPAYLEEEIIDVFEPRLVPIEELEIEPSSLTDICELSPETDKNSLVSIQSVEKSEVDILAERLNKLNKNGDGERFGKDGIKTILDLAEQNPDNISIINSKLDELEAGKSIWTYDITSAIKPNRENLVPIKDCNDDFDTQNSNLVDIGFVCEDDISQTESSTNPEMGDLVPIEEITSDVDVPSSSLVDIKTIEDPNALQSDTQITSANMLKKMQLESIFADSFSEIHLGQSTNPEVIEIENKMKDLGISVTFEDDLATAQVIFNTCSDLKAKGIELPSEIILMTPKKESTLGFTPIMREGFEKMAQIFIKKGLGELEDTSDPFFKSMGLNHFTDSTPAGTFVHELGHWHHLQDRLSDEDAMLVWQAHVNPSNEMIIAEEVSVHAMTDPTGKEYIAEVFAGLNKGEQYSETVMDIYQDLKGPILFK